MQRITDGSFYSGLYTCREHGGHCAVTVTPEQSKQAIDQAFRLIHKWQLEDKLDQRASKLPPSSN